MVSTGVLATMLALGVFTPSKVSAIDTAPTMVALPDEAGVPAEYRFTFVVTGTMTSGVGTIKITFDKDTQLPATISRSNVLISATRLSNNSPSGTIGVTGANAVVPLEFDPVIEIDTTDPARKVVTIKIPDMNPANTVDPGIGAQGIGTGYGTTGGMTDESLLGLGGDPARHHEVFSQVTVTFTKEAGLKNATEQETSRANIVAQNTILWPHSTNLVTGDAVTATFDDPSKNLNVSALIRSTLRLDLIDGARGSVVTATGRGFNDKTTATVWLDTNGDNVRDAGEIDLGSAVVGSDDTFTVSFTITAPPFKPGKNTIAAVDGEGRKINKLNTAGNLDLPTFELRGSVIVIPFTAAVGDTIQITLLDFPVFTSVPTTGAVTLGGIAVFVPPGITTSANGEAAFSTVVPNGVSLGFHPLIVNFAGSGDRKANMTIIIRIVTSVPSTQAWTDTGLVVSFGEVITVTASGTITFDSAGRNSGPNGSSDPPGGCSMLVTNISVTAHALVGNIASTSSLDGKGFLIGSSFQGTVPIANTTTQTGSLFLGFNDGFVRCDRSGLDSGGVGDNSGSFTATVTVAPAITANTVVNVPLLTNITVGTLQVTGTAVNVLNVPGGNLGAYQFQVSYNPAMVQATNVLGGAAPFNAVTAVNITNPVSGAGVAKWNHFQGTQTPVSTVSHTLASVVFQAVGMAGACSPLTITVVDLVNNQGVFIPNTKQDGQVCLAGIQAVAQTDLRAAQDVLDAATGIKATIDQITSTATGGGTLTGVLIHSYEANITFPLALAQATACRLKPPINLAPSDCTISAGLVHLKATTGVTGSGVATPLDPLAFVALRLLGSNNPAVGNTTVNLNFVEIKDSLGSLIPQASPPDTRTFLRGDALADGSISIGDALFIGQHLVNPTTRPAGEGPGQVNPVNAGSVNHDAPHDVISLADAVLIAQFLVGNLNEFYNP